MGFIRVRGASAGDPLHEFDASEAEVAANPELYVVLDPKPVDEARPQKYVPRSAEGVVKPARARKRTGGRQKPTAPAGAELLGEEDG